MMNSIIFRDDADAIEFLTAIGDLEGGAEALADYFTEKWSRIEAFARTGTFDTLEDDGDMLSEDALRYGKLSAKRGLRLALTEFIDSSPDWRIVLDHHHNNGLTILRRSA